MPRQRDERGHFVGSGGPKRGGGGVVIEDVDRGFRRMMQNLALYLRRPPFVTVGIQGREARYKRDFGQSNVTLAAVHEFGSRDGKIPQRSFIRSTVDRERGMILRMLERAVKDAARSGDAYRGLGIVGEKVKAEMVRTIDQSIGLKPLTKAGIRSKKRPSTKPLIDTGQLKGAITWKVHNA